MLLNSVFLSVKELFKCSKFLDWLKLVHQIINILQQISNIQLFKVNYACCCKYMLPRIMIEDFFMYEENLVLWGKKVFVFVVTLLQIRVRH